MCAALVESFALVSRPAPNKAATNRGRASRQLAARTRRRTRADDDGDPPSFSSEEEEELQSSRQRDVVSSNFWYTVVRTGDDDDDDEQDGNDKNEIIISSSSSRSRTATAETSTSGNINNKPPKILPKLPCVPTLDADGPLPRGAYHPLSQQQQQRCCRVQVAWDVTSTLAPQSGSGLSSEDANAMVETVQRFCDAGLSSFQIQTTNRQQQAWAERHVYGGLIRDTPQSVLQHCRLTVPLHLSDAAAVGVSDDTSGGKSSQQVTYKSTRAAVVESLSRMGSECVDDLQIQFPGGSSTEETNNYYLDLLDAVQELQRDGLVRGVSGRSMSEQFLHRAQRVGLGRLIETNQLDANLLDPDDALIATRTTKAKNPVQLGGATLVEEKPWTVVSNPLAGGWLTDRFLHVDARKQSMERLYHQRLSVKERSSWKRRVVDGPWARKHCPGGVGDFRNLLSVYQQQLLTPLQDVAHKHGVSIAAVVLRWTLQVQPQQVVGTVVTCRLLPEHHFWDGTPHHSTEQRIQDLRSVFRFALDEEDMERLLELSGHVEQEAASAELLGEEQDWLLLEQQQDEQMKTSSSGLFIPRSGDRFDFNFKP